MEQLQKLMDELLEWQKETFPTSDPIAKLHHLEREIPELIEELDKHYHNYGDTEATRMEYADCFLLLLGSAAMYGLSAEKIEKAIRDKLEINRKRKWGKPDAQGVVQHIKD